MVGPEITCVLLDVGATGFNSALEVIKGESDGKLAPGLAVGRAELEVLLASKLGKVSEASEAEGAGGKVDGSDEDGKGVGVKLADTVLVGSKGEGTSGKLEPCKFDGPVCNWVLKLGYCIC